MKFFEKTFFKHNNCNAHKVCRLLSSLVLVRKFPINRSDLKANKCSQWQVGKQAVQSYFYFIGSTFVGFKGGTIFLANERQEKKSKRKNKCLVEVIF